MTNLIERLEALTKAAIQTADDIRYYSGGSKHNQPAEDLAGQAAQIDSLQKECDHWYSLANQRQMTVAAKDAELAELRAEIEALRGALPQEHWTTKGAIKSARELIKAADALCFAAETSGGIAGRDYHLVAAIAHWVDERDKHKQMLRIIELEGHSPEIGAGILHPSARAALGSAE